MIAASALPEWVGWIAQDADGAWWGYEFEPLCFELGWYENELGRRVRLAVGEPNARWSETLTRMR